MNRALTARERDTLNALLARDFPGAAELRAQAASARVVGTCTCGCPTVDLAVDESAPRSVATRAEAEVAGQAAGVILFVHEGLLSLLEYWEVAEQRATQFPDPALLRF
ncbi:hypothetical protein GCM10010174_44890 [Kutzneria viridogrisea]|uniref:Uncharacterized protein n=2 Tax=Kutzneria TaxID=43356 RepID=W5WG36_9PSEU|nr:hypothetical protein [Kutzneria albida]AHH99822.1 hypothetical protein KALB_6463 [Kutzneria albida DSM 43870]MBA8924998.1 hypothetical protein [Kutzneria viridogrisea]